MAHMKFEIILMHLGLLSSSIIARTAIFASWSPVGKAHTSSVRGQKLLRGALQLAMQNLSAVPSRGTDSSNRRARSVCRSLIFVLRGEFLSGGLRTRQAPRAAGGKRSRAGGLVEVALRRNICKKLPAVNKQKKRECDKSTNMKVARLRTALQRLEL
jgi:hypothetical protein